jgi:hypothetical protein
MGIYNYFVEILFCKATFVCGFISFLIHVLHWRYGKIITKYITLVSSLPAIVWIIARLCNGLNLCCQLDVFTVYFIVWQFIYVIYKWNLFELPYFSFTLRQGLFCLSESIFAFVMHHIWLRYASVLLIFAFLWLSALADW